MNISYNWLRDLVPTERSPGDVAAQLTRVGLAVEGVHEHGSDHVLDLDLTSNRPDCLSHLGVARELSVIDGIDVIVPEDPAEIPIPTALASEIASIEDGDLCYRFTARIIRNVKVGPSPQWLVDRLEAVGERSINNVADITNYVMLELGQPMHAFDLDRLAGGRIVVRRARAGEMITTLDEVERKLDRDVLAICDAEKPVAIGGVMGGLDSSITEATGNVLLEVAYFDRASIRASSRRLNLATEASYRFERGVDIQNLKRASDRAANLICELAGGEKGDFADVYPNRKSVVAVDTDDLPAAVRRLTGLQVDHQECVRILGALGISARDTDENTFVVPSWRHDISIEEDLVEEVARHAGYENIADELPPAYHAGEYQPTEHRERALRQVLTDIGFDEAISYSFIDTSHDDVFEPVPGLIDERAEEPFVMLRDSVIEGAVRMRPGMLPGLLAAVRHNFNHQRRDLRLFELGRVFTTAAGEDGLPSETELLSLVVTGGEAGEGRKLATRELDFYDAKGGVEAALEALGFKNVEFSPAQVRHLRQGQSATISYQGKPLGYVGRLAEDIATAYKFRQPVYVAELNLTTLLQEPTSASVYCPLPRFPSVSRDVSLLVDRGVEFSSIVAAIRAQNYDLCRGVSFVDVYEGKGLGAGERSLTIRLDYRSDERTLVEDEVEAVHSAILAALASDLGVKQRA